ncbi:MAG: acyltransferase family protein [Sphingobacterium composti]
MYGNIKFFPNLNSLRFFAAILVLIHHGEVIREKNSFLSFADWSFFQNGGSAVRFFFILSGFLITYLLLKEKVSTQKINIKSFYFKRVVRIWPLYFLLVAIGVIILPQLFQILHINYAFPYSVNETWWMFLLFVPSLVTFRYGSHLLEPLWSIGVEEWFYIIWAPLFKWFKTPLIFIYSIIVSKIFLLFAIHINLIENETIVHLIKTYSFESMAIGGLGAYFIFHTKLNLQQVYSKYKTTNFLLITATFIYLFLNKNIAPFINEYIFTDLLFNQIVINILFLNIIIYCGVILSKKHWLNNKWLNIGGEISYGIYMYHMLVIFVCIHFLKNLLLPLNPYVSFICFYAFVIGGTITISYLSKRIFEDFFIKYKNRFDKTIQK